MAVEDHVVKLNFRGTTRTLFDITSGDWRFRLSRPTWPRDEQVVTFWETPAGTERELTEDEIEDDGEFLWCKPVGIVNWAASGLTEARLTIHRRTDKTQTWDPRPSSPVDLPAQATRLDRLTRMVQELWEAAVNALRFHPQEQDEVTGREVPLAQGTLPRLSELKGRVLGVSEEGRFVGVPLVQTALRVTPAGIGLAADGNGVISDFTATTVTAQVLRGLVDETSSWAIRFEASSGILLSPVSLASTMITAIETGVLAGWVDVVAEKAGGEQLVFRLAVTVTRVGAPGSSGSSVRISGPQVFSYPKGSTVPAPATPKTLTASVFHMVVSTVTWTVWGNGSWDPINDPAHISGVNTLALTVDHASALWGTKTQLRFRCTISDGASFTSDEFTIFKVVDGLDAFTVLLSNETHGIPCDSGGVPTPGELGPSGNAKTDIIVRKGTATLVGVTAVPTEGQFKVLSATGAGCSVTIEDADTVRIDSVSLVSGRVDIVIQIEGTDLALTKTMTWSKSLAGAPGAPGANGTSVGSYLGTSGDDPAEGSHTTGDYYYNTTTHTVRLLTAGTWADDTDSGRFAVAAPDIIRTEGATLGGNTAAVDYVNKLVSKDAAINALAAKTLRSQGATPGAGVWFDLLNAYLNMVGPNAEILLGGSYTGSRSTDEGTAKVGIKGTGAFFLRQGAGVKGFSFDPTTGAVEMGDYSGGAGARWDPSTGEFLITPKRIILTTGSVSPWVAPRDGVAIIRWVGAGGCGGTASARTELARSIGGGGGGGGKLAFKLQSMSKGRSFAFVIGAGGTTGGTKAGGATTWDGTTVAGGSAGGDVAAGATAGGAGGGGGTGGGGGCGATPGAAGAATDADPKGFSGAAGTASEGGGGGGRSEAAIGPVGGGRATNDTQCGGSTDNSYRNRLGGGGGGGGIDNDYGFGLLAWSGRRCSTQPVVPYQTILDGGNMGKGFGGGGGGGAQELYNAPDSSYSIIALGGRGADGAVEIIYLT